MSLSPCPGSEFPEDKTLLDLIGQALDLHESNKNVGEKN